MKAFNIIILLVCLLISALYFIFAPDNSTSLPLEHDGVDATNQYQDTSTDYPPLTPKLIDDTNFTIKTAEEMKAAESHIVACKLNNGQTAKSETDFNNKINAQLNLNEPDEYLASLLFFNNNLKINEKETNNSLNNALMNYFEKHSDEPLSFHRLLTQCTQSHYSYCEQSFYDYVAKVDKDNGMLWLTLASIYIKENNSELADKALLNASYAKNFNGYYFETIKLHRNTIKKYAPEQINEQLIAGIGYAAALPLGYEQAFTYCKASESMSIQEVCLQIGQNMEQLGKTRVQEMLGSGLQKIYHDRKGNFDISREIIAKHEDRVNFTVEMQAGNLLFYDNQLTEQWLSIAIENKEDNALAFLVQEAISLSKNPDYQPCPLIND